MINAFVQNGGMRILGISWRLRRLIVVIAALMVLAASIDVHTGSALFSVGSVSESTHTHDNDTENVADPFHKGAHHDHHTDFTIQAGLGFDAPPIVHEGLRDRSESRRVSIALDRPPDAAQC